MSRSLLAAIVSLSGLLLAGCGEALVSNGVADATADNRPQEIQALPQFPHKDLCPATGVPGEMHCMAKVRTDASGTVQPDTAPQGLSASDLQSAYKIPTSGGTGVTVAIVDAQDDPDAEADLATYRTQFGLPPCTTANGCFKKVNQSGQQSGYPTADQGWSGEIMLDLDMVSAACPNCHIILVEATSATQANLGAALNTAVSLGANAVSNSYGGTEDSSNSTYDSQYFNHPGVAITASAGDDGYGVEYPAASKYVTAVGGTTLAKSTSGSRGWVESVWGSASNNNGGTGSGCSSYTTKPSYQTDPSCSKRMVADVAAVADPNSGVAVYDKYGSGGWVVIGGTSAASPLVASILALTGHTADALGYSYSHTSDFFDVTTGVNGSCTTAYFCKGAVGYDGPTGNGTPNGTALLGGSATTTSSTSTTATGATSTTGSGATTSTTSAGSTTAGSTTATSTSGGSTSGGSTGGSGVTVLVNGVPATNLSGATNSKTYFTLAVPAGATSLDFAISGGSGDADLYVKFGATPTTSSYDCRPYVNGNAESCPITSAQAGTYYVMINGYAAYAGLTLEGSYSAGSTAATSTTGTTGSGATTTTTGSGSTSGTTGSGSTTGSTTGTSGSSALQNGVARTNLSGATNSKTYFTVAVPAGASNLNIAISGGTGDADLYVKLGANPTTSTYDCRPYVTGNTESCASASPTAGTYYIMLNGYAAYAGLSLEASWTTSSGGSGGTSGTVLQNGVEVDGLSGATNSQKSFSFTVPASASTVTVEIGGGTGDADLYVRFGSAPTLTTYDCRPYVTGNSETCTLPAQAGTYDILINSYQAYSGLSIEAAYQ